MQQIPRRKHTPLTTENLDKLKGLLYGKTPLWYLIRDYNSGMCALDVPKLSPDAPLEEFRQVNRELISPLHSNCIECDFPKRGPASQPDAIHYACHVPAYDS